MQLVLARHGESVWNKENLFTGWTDVDLSEKGWEEAREAGKLLKLEKFDFDICFTSYLKRAIHTLNMILEEMDREYLPVLKAWQLNERHYGALQGLNKAETTKKYGEEQVKLWRRSFDVAPPPLQENDERLPSLQDAYRDVPPSSLPLTESLKITIERVVPYFESEIKPLMKEGKRVLIVAHGNSLRSLVKYFENISDKDIVDVNIPTAVPLVYNFDSNFNVSSKSYLGDIDAINAKINSVSKQASISK
ncbi:MAG: 2,3-diphosphoglycerate-dependent phosphoglycerate mutase [Treponema sp.]